MCAESLQRVTCSTAELVFYQESQIPRRPIPGSHTLGLRTDRGVCDAESLRQARSGCAGFTPIGISQSNPQISLCKSRIGENAPCGPILRDLAMFLSHGACSWGSSRVCPLPKGVCLTFLIGPNRIVLYQKNIEAVCSSEAEIRHQVRQTVLHELGALFRNERSSAEGCRASTPDATSASAGNPQVHNTNTRDLLWLL